MEQIVQSVLIKAPIETCYEYSVDMTNLESWGNGILESRLASANENSEHDYEVKIGLPFLNTTGTYTTFNRKPKEFSFMAKTGTSVIKMEDLYKFEKYTEIETKLTLTHEALLSSPWDKTGLIYQLIANSQIYLDLRNLKTRIENQ